MESVSIRTKLHEYIDMADERKLEAIYVILESDMDPLINYSTSDIALLHERRNRHLAGNSKSYTVSESFDEIRHLRKSTKKPVKGFK